jgi:glycosyltransferase involved in cell wall biosynthesis
VTYSFIHANFLHLAFNLLALFVFGPPVEERMGGGTFLAYYGLCGLGGAALSFALAMTFQQVQLVVGASAAVYGVMLAFAWAWPDQPISVFPLPEPIAAKWLVTFAVAVSLLLALLPTNDGVAHLAHLGGFATGLLYLKVADWRLGRAERQLRRATEPSVLVHPARYEAYGLGVHEALCSGLPAFVTRSAGVAERIPAALDELLLDDPPRAEDLAARLRRWNGSVDEHRLRIAGLGAELRRRSWSDMAREIVDLVERSGA